MTRNKTTHQLRLHPSFAILELLEDRSVPAVTWIAQGPSPTRFGQVEGMTAQSNPVSGAGHVVLTHPTNADIIWVGTTNGGIWKTTNATASSPTWTPLTDEFPGTSIGAMSLDPTDVTHQTLIAGIGKYSSLGNDGGPRSGLLRSTDGGTTWTQITGSGTLLGKNISGVIARGNTIVVSVNIADNFTYANIGTFRSTDGGASFTQISSASGSGLPGGTCFDLASDPSNQAVLYTSVKFAGASNGVYKSTNTGATWSLVGSPAMNALILDSGSITTSNVEFAVGNSNNVFAGIVNNGRLAGLFRSGDSGGTWTAMDLPEIVETTTNTITAATNASPIVITSNGHGQRTNDRVQITGALGNSAANGTWTITVIDSNRFSLNGSTGNGTYTGSGVWQSVQGLEPNEKPDVAGGQGAIHFSIVADPTNSNIVYVGGDRQPLSNGANVGSFPNAIGALNYTGRLFRGNASLASGSQWTPLTHNFSDPDGVGIGLPGTAPHADSRDMAFDANGNIIEVDDGGIYKRSSPTSSTGIWTGLHGNMQNAEIHSIDYDRISNILIAGTQDTGTPQQTTTGSLTWDSVSQGDGGVVAVDDISLAGSNQSIRYSSFQNFSNFRRQTYNSSNGFVSQTVPSLLVGATSLYNTDSTIQFYQRFVLNSINPVRGLIGTNTLYESTNRFDNLTSVQASTGFAITAMVYGGSSASVPNEDLIYYAKDTDIFLRTTSGGSFTNLTAYAGGSITDIALNPHDWNHVYVTDGSNIYRSLNAGTSWTDITGNIGSLVGGSIRTIEYVPIPGGNGAILVGGAGGVFSAIASSPTAWNTFGPNLPNAIAYDMRYDSGDDLLVVGTLGRGAWTISNASQQFNSQPVVTLPGLVQDYVENAAPISIDANATVADTDSANFSGGTLTVDYTANGTIDDRLTIFNQGTAAGQIGVSGANVSFGGTTIGTFTGGSGTTPLVVTLNTSATPTAVESLVRNITFSNVSDNPATATRTVRFVVSDGISSSTAVTKSLTLTAVNDEPTLNTLPTLTINEGAGQQIIALGGITAGGGETQTLSVTGSSDTTTLIPNPSITYNSPNISGSFRFTPVPDAFGTAIITVELMDDGGTFNGGDDKITRTLTVNVNPVNDVPSFTKGPDVSVVLNAPAQVFPNWATAISVGPANESSQTRTFLVTADNTSLFAVQPEISSAGILTFTPAANVTNSTIVRVRIQDNGGTLNGGVDTSAEQTFVISVGVNQAPVLDDSGSPTLNPVPLETIAPEATLVSQFGVPGVSDAEFGTIIGGVAVINVDQSSGNWEYSLNAGQTWSSLNGVTTTDARVLGPTDLVRFIPTGTVTGTAALTFHAWDQSTDSSGDLVDLTTVGGNTAYSTASEIATIRIASNFTLTSEDVKGTGSLISAISGATIGDGDPLAKRGIAIIGAGGQLAGTWEYQVGRTWKPLKTVSASSVLLLSSTQRLRFVPTVANTFGEAWLQYRAWDQTTGTVNTFVDLSSPTSIGVNTAFSAVSDVIFGRVLSVNDKPLIDITTTAELPRILPTNNDPTGELVKDLLASTVTDADVGTIPGIAVTTVSKTGGVWQFQRDGQTTWDPFPTLSTKAAILLRPLDRIRFRPNGTFSGKATFSYKAWDQSLPFSTTAVNTTIGTSFSVSTKAASILVTTIPAPTANVAPILDNVPNVNFPTVNEDSKPLGQTVSNLLGTAVTDSIGASKGIALTGVTGTANGIWQYSTNGSTWKPVGIISTEMALLLKETDRLRYLPNLNISGTATISYHAWDQTRGTAYKYANLALPDVIDGSTPFSLATETATVTVDPVNDSPVLNLLPTPYLTTILPTANDPVGNLVSELLGTAVTDVDPGTLYGIAITKIDQSKGTWSYQLDGQNTWNVISPLATNTAVFLRSIDRLRFTPTAPFTGSAAVSYRAWDQTSGPVAGASASTVGLTSISKAIESAKILVSTQNTKPILDTKPVVRLPSMAVNDADPIGISVASILGNAVLDPDAGALRGIAVTGLDNRFGTWQCSINGGGWNAIGTVSTTAAMLLKSPDLIRFVPTLSSNFRGNSTMKFKAWDQSDSQTAGAIVNTNTSAYSTAIEIATITVNTGPNLTLI